MKLKIEIEIESVDEIDKNPDSIARIEYPDEGNKIYIVKGLDKLGFKQSLLHEIGHLFDWYLSGGKQSDDVDVREKNAELIEFLKYRRKKKKFYLRFKDIPENEVSGIYNGDCGKIGEEIGVSCFLLSDDLSPIVPMKIDDNKITTNDNIIRFLHDFSWMMGDFLEGFITAYVITGDEVGIGSDGEPLLKNIEIIKKLESPQKPIKQTDQIVDFIETDPISEREYIIDNLKKVMSTYCDRENENDISEIFKLIKKL